MVSLLFTSSITMAITMPQNVEQVTSKRIMFLALFEQLRRRYLHLHCSLPVLTRIHLMSFLNLCDVSRCPYLFD